MTTKIAWAVLLLFVILGFVIGATEAFWFFLLCIGIFSFIVGTLIIFNSQFRKKWYSMGKRDLLFERMFSEKQRSILDQYYFGGKVMLGGLGFIVLYWVSHLQLFASILTWLKNIF